MDTKMTRESRIRRLRKRRTQEDRDLREQQNELDFNPWWYDGFGGDSLVF